MSTAPRHSRIVLTTAQKAIFQDLQGKVASTTDFNTGDLLCWDSTNHIVYLPTAESNGSTFLGISDVSVNEGVILPTYQGTDNSASQPSYEIMGPVYGVVARLILKTGDSLNIGDYVYLDPTTGTQNVQASGTKAIGTYVGSAAVSSAAAGTQVLVLLGARFPNDTLKF
jgi:hypothetical protein